MCGKPNPEDRELCQFCNARLKPLIKPPAEDPDTSSLLSGTPPTPQDTSELEQTLPAWLQNARKESDEDEPMKTEDDDWLQHIQDLESGGKTTAEKQPATNGRELPDWLSGLDDEYSQIEEEENEEEDLPDWLLKFREEPDALEEEADELSPIDDVPDWVLEGIEKPDGEEIPDWFAETEPEKSEAEYKPEAEYAFAAEEVSSLFEDAPEEETPEETGEEEMPDWLLEETPPGEAVQFSSEETKDASVQPFQLDGEEDIFEDALPAWLTAASASEVVDEDQPGKMSDELSSSELPGWVEAMRPVAATPDQDIIIQTIDEEYIENSGPLAGIANILPAETGISEFQKTTKHSFKLKVTPSQQKYVSILDDLISKEEVPKLIPEPNLISTQRVLWWVIALVLLLFVGAAIQYGGGQFPYPLHLEENLVLNKLVQSLPENAPVLIAFEYEPALSGEMNAVAAGIVDHLMFNNALLTFISTSPTGPILAENFLNTVQARNQYIHGKQYVNLGYLPGDAAGLLSFAIAPQTIMPLAIDGTNAWATQPLQDVKLLSDFSLVLIVTDDPDTARVWIEQVQPHLEGTPLGVVASAQAAPLIRPYYESTPKQIAGLIAGIPEGAAYEQLNARGNLSQAYWNAFNIGVSATLVVLLIGGIVNLIAGSFHKKKANKNKEHA